MSPAQMDLQNNQKKKRVYIQTQEQKVFDLDLVTSYVYSLGY